jgi:hypothetical protein
MHSLSETPLVADARFDWKWQPTQPAFEQKTLEDVVEPQDKTVARKRQIKALATKFSACEYFLPGHTRHELRLLPHPLYEYEDESANILDGALFAFVHGGSNPEAILLIEAIGSETKPPVWRFGFVRLSHAELHAEFDGKEVWTQRRVEGMQRTTSPYFSVIPSPAPP